MELASFRSFPVLWILEYYVMNHATVYMQLITLKWVTKQEAHIVPLAIYEWWT
jgi:hypothetical protein